MRTLRDALEVSRRPIGNFHPGSFWPENITWNIAYLINMKRLFLSIDHELPRQVTAGAGFCVQFGSLRHRSKSD